MRLTQITEKLNKELHFPYVHVVEQHNLCDSIYLAVGQEPKEEWANGYIENSKYIKAIIFCNGNTRWEDDNSTYKFTVVSNTTGIKIMQKKNLTGEKVVDFVLSQLKKLQVKTERY